MRRALLLAPLVAASLLSTAAGQDGALVTERHYEVVRNGRKEGYTKVTWAPSTWQGRATVHDTTTIVSVSVRDMAGVRDRFESSTTIDLERDRDGTLWWQRAVVEEGTRTITSELTWTGSGYVYEARADDHVRRIEVPLPAPVMTDAEAFLGERARAGTLAAGDRFELRLLDLAARRATVHHVRVVGPEEVEGEAGPVACIRVVERDPASGAETVLWLDREGAFVRIATDGGTVHRRVTRERAEDMPQRPAEFSVTTPAEPALERVFTATRLDVDLQLQRDPDRALPELPVSPWSRVVALADEGHTLSLVLLAHDDPEARAPYPIEAAGFEADLEPTTLLPCDHPELVAAAREVVGDAADAREAARRLVRFVFESLAKRSPEVASTTALEILRDREGDCSEHCVLFVALCRAAGIPARRCSGYACVGTQWGGHAWAEVWVGTWIGADPTTGELGTAARYVFFGYPDRPDSFPGVVSARASGRLRIVTTAVEDQGRTIDLRDPAGHRVHDPAAGRYEHVLAGLELRGVPESWRVQVAGDGWVFVHGPGLEARIVAAADQGYTLDMLGGPNATFGGAPAYRVDTDGGAQLYVHSRRRLVRIEARGGEAELAALEGALEGSLR